jgi:hypothetical protein
MQADPHQTTYFHANLACKLCCKYLCCCAWLGWPRVCQQHSMQVQQIHAALLSKLAAARRAAVRRHLLLLLLLLIAVLLPWRLVAILLMLLLLLLVFRFRLDLASSLWMSSRQMHANIQVCVVSACT